MFYIRFFPRIGRTLMFLARIILPHHRIFAIWALQHFIIPNSLFDETAKLRWGPNPWR